MPSWVCLVFLLMLKISLQGRWASSITGEEREARRGEVTLGSASQEIKAKHEFNFIYGEKVGTQWDFSSKKLGSFPSKVFSEILKNSLSKNKRKKTPAAQDYCLKQGLAICHKGKVDFKIFHHCGQRFHTQALLFSWLKPFSPPKANKWRFRCHLWKAAHQLGLQGMTKGHRREKRLHI